MSFCLFIAINVLYKLQTFKFVHMYAKKIIIRIFFLRLLSQCKNISYVSR
jgi:hypothetical protein